MRGGFSFCGKEIATFGLEYAPDIQHTYVYQGSGYNLTEQSVGAHDGGYFYGASMKPKDFVLRCFFEETNINEGIISNILSFFYCGRTGKLVFEKREWIWYNATVIGVDLGGLLNGRNGYITINLRAYYPFGRCNDLFLSEDELSNYGNRLRNSGLLPQNITPSCSIIDSGNTLTESISFLLYNGGCEKAHVAIEIAGDAPEGVTITNKTTRQVCKFIALSNGLTTSVGKYIVCDGLNGKTMLTDGETYELSFLYHDSGFIDLAPSFPVDREVEIRFGYKSVSIVSNSIFNESYVGKYIWLQSKWRKITAVVNDSLAYINEATETAGVEYTSIVSMNEIVVEPVGNIALTRLNFIYKPTFQ